MNEPDGILNWQLVKKEPGPDLTLFQARFDWLENPRNGHRIKATVIEAPDWVNVVALTPEHSLVLVKQYRFGIEGISLEIPAGVVDPGEQSRITAERELLEETGYSSQDWEYLGWVSPNPAYLNNRCHHWLARDVTRTSSPVLDAGESVEVLVLSLDEIRDEIRSGLFRHSLSFSALSQVFDIQGYLHQGDRGAAE